MNKEQLKELRAPRIALHTHMMVVVEEDGIKPPPDPTKHWKQTFPLMRKAGVYIVVDDETHIGDIAFDGDEFDPQPKTCPYVASWENLLDIFADYVVNIDLTYSALVALIPKDLRSDTRKKAAAKPVAKKAVAAKPARKSRAKTVVNQLPYVTEHPIGKVIHDSLITKYGLAPTSLANKQNICYSAQDTQLSVEAVLYKGELQRFEIFYGRDLVFNFDLDFSADVEPDPADYFDAELATELQGLRNEWEDDLGDYQRILKDIENVDKLLERFDNNKK